MVKTMKLDIQNAVLKIYFQGYIFAATLIGVYYLVLIPVHFYAQKPGVGMPMIGINILTAAVLFLTVIAIRKQWVRPEHWHLVAITSLAAPIANHLVLVALTKRLDLTSDLMMILAASSVVSPKPRWHIAILTLCQVCWWTSILLIKPQGDFTHWMMGMITASLVSTMLHGIVSRLSWTQAQLRIRDACRAKKQERIARQLQMALNNVKRLGGLIPICGHCKKIRADDGYWTQVERYIEQHSEAEFTHGLCPDCIQQLRLEFEDYIATSESRRKPHALGALACEECDGTAQTPIVG